jgi:hypothetical protein
MDKRYGSGSMPQAPVQGAYQDLFMGSWLHH